MLRNVATPLSQPFFWLEKTQLGTIVATLKTTRKIFRKQIAVADANLEKDLATQAASGDKLALQRLLMMHSAKLAKHAQSRLPASIQGVVDADDIVQQTFMDAFHAIERFEYRGDGSFWAWLSVLADRRVQTSIKAQNRIKRGGQFKKIEAGLYSDADLAQLLSAASHTPSMSVVRHDAVQAIHDAVLALPDDYRQAVDLRMLQGKTLEEVADALGRSPRAVQGLIDRAKKKMRAALGRLSLYE